MDAGPFHKFSQIYLLQRWCIMRREPEKIILESLSCKSALSQEAVTGDFTEESKLLADRGAKIYEGGQVILPCHQSSMSTLQSNPDIRLWLSGIGWLWLLCSLCISQTPIYQQLSASFRSMSSRFWPWLGSRPRWCYYNGQIRRVFCSRSMVLMRGVRAHLTETCPLLQRSSVHHTNSARVHTVTQRKRSILR